MRVTNRSTLIKIKRKNTGYPVIYPCSHTSIYLSIYSSLPPTIHPPTYPPTYPFLSQPTHSFNLRIQPLLDSDKHSNQTNVIVIIIINNTIISKVNIRINKIILMMITLVRMTIRIIRLMIVIAILTTTPTVFAET